MKTTLTCDYCKQEYRTDSSHLKYKNHFCSRTCKGKWMSENIRGMNHHNRKLPLEWTCLNCNKIFPNKTGHPRKYCSTKCQLDYEYKTGKRDRFETTKAANKACRKGATHQNFRRRVFNFYPNICVYCGSTENLEAHHIIPQEYDERRPTGKGDHRVRNGCILCRDCHQDIVHKKRSKRFSKNLNK